MAKSSIKTAYLGGLVNGAGAMATATDVEDVLDTWVSQDNIRIVAIEVGMLPNIIDAALNADGALTADTQVSRSGRADQPGCLLRATVACGWTGVIGVGGPSARDATVNFPTGSGVDIDSGETLNLILRGRWVGTGTLVTYSYAIIHYIER